MAQEFAHDVFLSHNSKDKSIVRALAERLRADGVRVWFDETSIAIGEHIGVALEQGLQTSRHIVLIMSPHTFASDWVTAERWSALFPDPLNKNRRFVPVLLADCQIPQILQSYKFVDYRDQSDAAYAQILNACKAQNRPVTPRPPGPDGRFALTVHLSVQGGQLQRTFHNHQRTFLDDSHSRFADRLNFWRTDPEMCQNSPQFTNALWEALFGPDDPKTLALLNQVTGDDLKTPIYAPLRVRIYTQDALLAELPWSLTTWQDQKLTRQGWTFELTATPPQDNTSHYRVDLPSPFPVVLLAPAGDSSSLEWDMHQRDVEQKFRDLWRVTSGFIHTVTHRADLTRLRQQLGTVGLLYYYGPAQVAQGKLSIALPAGSNLSLDALVQAWGAGSVQAVFLNLVQEEALPLGTTLAELSAQVPLVISQTTRPAAWRQAQETFVAWLHDLLSGADPLQALHTRGHASAVAWRNMDHWHVDPRGRDRIPIQRLGYLLLDRTEERALVNRAVDDLVDRGKRLTCIVAYAEENNRPDLFFPEQAREYLLTHARDKVSVELYAVPFPPDRQPTQSAFEKAVRSAFAIANPDFVKGFERALEDFRERRFAGKLRGTARPLLLLDWKVWKTTARSRIKDVLEAWTRFHQHLLFPACPRSLHVLAGLALESAATRHVAIQQAVDRLRMDRDIRIQRAFTLEKTAHLRHVSHDDLVDFFIQNQEELGCTNQDLCFDLADLIHRQTDGQYDAICTYIAQRQNASWERLLADWQHNG